MNHFRNLLVGSLLALAPQAHACDLALALAVDVSGSVDHDEYRIQMDGLAAALRDPVVSESLVRGRSRILLLQWTGSTRQRITIPWTDIDSFATLDMLAERIANDPRIWRNYSTAVGEALGVALTTFEDAQNCRRKLIDLSGDGPSNEGIAPTDLRRALRDAGITVNAIAIEESEPDLTAYFFENVITGDGAFVVTASGFSDYPEKIRMKLVREVSKQSSAVPVPAGDLRRAAFDRD